jgi:hypothetical protein
MKECKKGAWHLVVFLSRSLVAWLTPRELTAAFHTSTWQIK